MLDKIEDALKSFEQGNVIIIIDDENRENEGDFVARWRPSIAKFVVIDPKRSFGAPIVDSFGISTKTIFCEYEIDNNARRIASDYEIPLKYVNDAIRFEQGLISAGK